jgi:hypothetical protein
MSLTSSPREASIAEPNDSDSTMSPQALHDDNGLSATFVPPPSVDFHDHFETESCSDSSALRVNEDDSPDSPADSFSGFVVGLPSQCSTSTASADIIPLPFSPNISLCCQQQQIEVEAREEEVVEEEEGLSQTSSATLDTDKTDEILLIVSSMLQHILLIVLEDSRCVTPLDFDHDNAPSRGNEDDAVSSVYDSMLMELQKTQPVILGIRFELLLDGSPDQLGQKSESQLHVVVVRQISWQNVISTAWFRFVLMLACMLYMLCYLFGPITGSIALVLLNNKQLVRKAAAREKREGGRGEREDGVDVGNSAGGALEQRTSIHCLDCAGQAEQCADCKAACNMAMFTFKTGKDNDVEAAFVMRVSWVCLAIVPLSHYYLDEYAVPALFTWLIEKFFGVILIRLAYSTLGKEDSFDQRFNQARSMLVMLAFQFVVVLSVMYLLRVSSDSSTLWSLLSFFAKLLIIGCFALLVIWCPTRFYFCCTDFFSISGLPQFQEPPLFVFNTEDITKVLHIRNAIRKRSQNVVDLLHSNRISHILPNHVDGVCVGHVTTERWASVLLLPSVYNSLRLRKLVYLTYSYFLPIINILYILAFPSDSLRAMFSYIYQSFQNDFTVYLLTWVRWIVERVASVFIWALNEMIHDAIKSVALFFYKIFEWSCSHVETISSYIATFDQWVSYIASRLVPFKYICSLIIRITQGLGGIFFNIFSVLNPFFTKVLPHMTNAPNTAGKVDMIGRLAQSGLVRSIVGKWNCDQSPLQAHKLPKTSRNGAATSLSAKKNE